MLVISNYQQKGVFERLVRAKNGAMMRVRFEVYEVDRELKGKVIAIEPVLAIRGNTSSINCLPGVCALNSTSIEYISPFNSVISPYNELYFFKSQPTRAPAIK